MSFKCPTCNQRTAVEENGLYRCSDEECGAIWWGPFDRPYAGKKQKGYKCPNCTRQTIHPVGEISKVTVYRCSSCGAAILEQN